MKQNKSIPIPVFDHVLDKAHQLADKLANKREEGKKKALAIAKSLAQSGYDESIIYNVLHDMQYSTYGCHEEITAMIEKNKGKKKKRASTSKTSEVKS